MPGVERFLSIALLFALLGIHVLDTIEIAMLKDDTANARRSLSYMLTSRQQWIEFNKIIMEGCWPK